MSTTTDLMTETDRTSGMDAKCALPSCSARLTELLKAIATDGTAGAALLALVADMAGEVEELALELVADGMPQPN